MEEKVEQPTFFREAGNEAAIEQIMDQYGEGLKRFIFTYVKNRSTTDDIFQDVMITVYKKLSSVKERKALKQWLYKIAANKSKDYLRSPWNKRMIWKDINGKSEITPEKSFLQDESKKRVIEAIMSLPMKYREVLILQYYQEFSIEEISTLLNVNPSTVRTRIMRAKEKLKTKLKGDEFND